MADLVIMQTTLQQQPAEFADSNLAQIRETISRLQLPVQNVQTLLALVTAPLHCLGLLSPQYARYNASPSLANQALVLKHISVLQRSLLEHIIPVWESALKEDHNFGLIEQYFCPDSFSFTSPAAGEVALSAYSVILSLPLTDYSIHFLVRLAKAYPIDVLRETVFSGPSRAPQSRGAISWEDCVKDVVAIPPKVANALGARGASVPTELEQRPYFNHLSIRCERMIFKMSEKYSRGQWRQRIFRIGH